MKVSIAAIFAFALSISLATSIEYKIHYQEIKTVALEKQLKVFLESLKDVMRSGNDTLGIPVLEPFTTDFQNVTINDNLLSIDFNASNAEIRGLSDYKVNEANFRFFGKQLTLNLTWMSVRVKSSYGLHAFQKQWPDFPIYGNGSVEFDAKDFTFAVKIRFNVDKGTKKLSVNTLSSSVSLGSIDFRATGIYNDEEASETVSKMISSSLPHVIDFHQSLFIGTIDSELTKLVDSYVCDKTLDDVIKMIS